MDLIYMDKNIGLETKTFNSGALSLTMFQLLTNYRQMHSYHNVHQNYGPNQNTPKYLRVLYKWYHAELKSCTLLQTLRLLLLQQLLV